MVWSVCRLLGMSLLLRLYWKILNIRLRFLPFFPNCSALPKVHVTMSSILTHYNYHLQNFMQKSLNNTRNYALAVRPARLSTGSNPEGLVNVKFCIYRPFYGISLDIFTALINYHSAPNYFLFSFILLVFFSSGIFSVLHRYRRLYD